MGVGHVDAERLPEEETKLVDSARDAQFDLGAGVVAPRDATLVSANGEAVSLAGGSLDHLEDVWPQNRLGKELILRPLEFAVLLNQSVVDERAVEVKQKEAHRPAPR